MSNLVVLTLSRMGELPGKTIEHNARTRWWRILGLMALAFLNRLLRLPPAWPAAVSLSH
jgi:hypothetical protein